MLVADASRAADALLSCVMRLFPHSMPHAPAGFVTAAAQTDGRFSSRLATHLQSLRTTT